MLIFVCIVAALVALTAAGGIAWLFYWHISQVSSKRAQSQVHAQSGRRNQGRGSRYTGSTPPPAYMTDSVRWNVPKPPSYETVLRENSGFAEVNIARSKKLYGGRGSDSSSA